VFAAAPAQSTLRRFVFPARTGDQLILEATFVPLKGLWLLFRRRSTRPCLTGG
jgi:hypothetical protein